MPCLWFHPGFTLTGDFNWHYPRLLPLPPGWVDVWAQLMPHHSGHTWSSVARTGQATRPVSSELSRGQ